MDFTIEHIIPLSREEYWKILHTPEFETFQAKELGLKVYDEIAREQEGTIIRRRVKVKPEAQLPASVQKIVSSYISLEDLGYIEEQVRYDDKYYLEFRIHPPVLKDRIHIAGVFSLEERDEQSCLRLLEGEIKISMFGVGGIVERFILEELRRTYEKIPGVVEKWKRQGR